MLTCPSTDSQYHEIGLERLKSVKEGKKDRKRKKTRPEEVTSGGTNEQIRTGRRSCIMKRKH